MPCTKVVESHQLSQTEQQHMQMYSPHTCEMCLAVRVKIVGRSARRRRQFTSHITRRTGQSRRRAPQLSGRSCMAMPLQYAIVAIVVIVPRVFSATDQSELFAYLSVCVCVCSANVR